MKDLCLEKKKKKNVKIQKNNEDKLSYQIKIKILKIYSILLYYFEDNERLSEDLIQFLLDLIDFLTTEESNFLLKEVKEVLSILIDIYVKKLEILSSNQPIQNLFDNLIRYLIEKILEEDTYANKYFSILIGIYKNLYMKNIYYIKDIQLRIIYSIKQLVYKNVDSQNFRNPLIIKSMYGLNDIDSTIVNKKFIIEYPLYNIYFSYKDFYKFQLKLQNIYLHKYLLLIFFLLNILLNYQINFVLVDLNLIFLIF
jgi:hypothetical protein